MMAEEIYVCPKCTDAEKCEYNHEKCYINLLSEERIYKIDPYNIRTCPIIARYGSGMMGSIAGRGTPVMLYELMKSYDRKYIDRFGYMSRYWYAERDQLLEMMLVISWEKRNYRLFSRVLPMVKRERNGVPIRLAKVLKQSYEGNYNKFFDEITKEDIANSGRLIYDLAWNMWGMREVAMKRGIFPPEYLRYQSFIDDIVKQIGNPWSTAIIFYDLVWGIEEYRGSAIERGFFPYEYLRLRNRSR